MKLRQPDRTTNASREDAKMGRVEEGRGQVLIIGTLVAASIGAPGAPGVGIVILTNVVVSVGIPTDGLALVLGMDRLLDMCRTSVNVTGDLTACVLLDDSPS